MAMLVIARGYREISPHQESLEDLPGFLVFTVLQMDDWGMVYEIVLIIYPY